MRRQKELWVRKPGEGVVPPCLISPQVQMGALGRLDPGRTGMNPGPCG
jgi:hypothetical protein